MRLSTCATRPSSIALTQVLQRFTELDYPFQRPLHHRDALWQDLHGTVEINLSQASPVRGSE